MIHDQGVSLGSILSSTTQHKIRNLGPLAIQLAQRWVKERPDRARELEATGEFVPTLKQEADEESLRQWRARVRTLARPATGGGGE